MARNRMKDIIVTTSVLMLGLICLGSMGWARLETAMTAQFNDRVGVGIESYFDQLGWGLSGHRCGKLFLMAKGGMGCQYFTGHVDVQKPEEIIGSYYLRIESIELGLGGRSLRGMIRNLILERRQATGLSSKFKSVLKSVSSRGPDIKLKRITVRRLMTQMPFKASQFSFSDVRSIAASLVGKLYRLFSHGETTQSVRLQGDIELYVDGQLIIIPIRVAKFDQKYSFVVDPFKLQELAKVLDEGINAAEAKFLSRHPFQMVEMLQIKRYARLSAREAALQDMGVPRDAYRHILWSYLMTREFGPKLAEELTDAHEEGIALISRDRHIDLRHNALGREWAELGVKEKDLLHLVKTDSRVVKNY